MASKFLEGPKLVDAVEYGLRPVDQPTSHLLQVAQHGDVTVRLNPRCGHAHHHHLWIGGHQLLIHSQTWRGEEVRGKVSVSIKMDE